MKLETYGWNPYWSDIWKSRSQPQYLPARIIADHGTRYKIATPTAIDAMLAGSLVHKLSASQMPKVGDWVTIEELGPDHVATIHAVLPRISEIVRGQVGKKHDKQVVAANIDLAFIMQPLDHDFSPERLERYLFQLAAQNIETIILLNKTDKVSDGPAKQQQITDLGVETILLSALHDQDISAIQQYLQPGKTAVIMGSSGAGKSTLTNRLIGENRQATQAVREHDSKGRHTTVHRELFVLPSGGMLIDTPGIRELQLWGDYNDLELAFPEIAAAIRSCHYPHCSHTNERGCAVQDGIENGTIDPIRYNRFQNFMSELDRLEKKRGFINDRKAQQTRETAKKIRIYKTRADQANNSWDE